MLIAIITLVVIPVVLTVFALSVAVWFLESETMREIDKKIARKIRGKENE